MKALVYHGPGSKAWEEIPDPRPASPIVVPRHAPDPASMTRTPTTRSGVPQRVGMMASWWSHVRVIVVILHR